MNTESTKSTESTQKSKATADVQGAQRHSEATPPLEVVKQYNTRGGWTLHRLATATGFLCNCCSKEKKAKLVATRDGLWDKLCCNACYGQLLSTQK
ncbi:hypothetical protein BKA66DRAFT_182046 [Pyrenochaeta sp. MPI-SDFR-AT-0127]|nr:hypothetical protein BKA66DRAFT_182046 [Pyrenochaeta sp. MPI-SDFR-AT-0127]